MKIIVFLIFILVSAFSFAQTSYQEITSLVDHSIACPKSEKSLFRGIRGNFFSGIRIIKNMFGEELEEHPSWALSNSLKIKYNNSYTLEQFHAEKLIIAKQLYELKKKLKKKRLPICAMSFAIETYITLENKDSMGIPASESFEMASAYATLFGGEEGSIIQIKENFPRAGKDPYMSERIGLDEFYFPVSIPFNEIDSAWTSDNLYIKKQEINGEVVVEIRMYRWSRDGQEERSPDVEGEKVISIKKCNQGQICSNLNSAAFDNKYEGFLVKVVEYANKNNLMVIEP